MSALFELKTVFSLTESLTARIEKYFADSSGEVSSRTSTNSQDDADSFLDADRPAGVADWNDEPMEEDVIPTAGSALFQKCIVDTYSNTDNIFLGNGQKWIILSRSPSGDSVYDIRTMHNMGKEVGFENEDISCCCLFGLGSARRSELLDCIIVAIGTYSGQLAFFTDGGTLLFHESFAENVPILSISFDHFEDGQQFTVVTVFDIFVVNAVSLHSLLTKAKLSIAKGEHSVRELADTLELDCERVGLSTRSRIRYALFTGLESLTSFNQYVAASFDDFNRRVERSSPPKYMTFFLNSTDMLATFGWHLDGEEGSVWSEAVNKISSSIIPHFGFRKFFGIPSPSDRKPVLSQSRKSLQSRGVINEPRTITFLSRAPNFSSLIAFVDDKARVILVDYKHRQIVRIWKGYRDASVSWITASSDGATVLFLVIFAPRRGLIEVWSMQNGGRVAAQHVDCNGLLISGGNSLVLCGRKLSNDESRTFFVDSKGAVLEIFVPFHLSLVKTESNDQHDQLVLKKFPTTADSFDEKKVLSMFASLRTQMARRDILLSLIKLLSVPDYILRFLNMVVECDKERQALGELPSRISDLVDGYKRILGYHSRINFEEEAEVVDFSSAFGEAAKTYLLTHLLTGERLGEHTYELPSLMRCVDWRKPVTRLDAMGLSDCELLALAEFIFLPVFTSIIDSQLFLEDFEKLLPFSIDEYAGILAFFILKSSFAIAPYSSAIVDLIINFSVVFENSLDEIERCCMTSRFTSRSVSLFGLLSVARKRIFKPFNDQKVEELWEPLDPSTEHADSTLTLLHVNYLCSEVSCTQHSYQSLLSGGAGYIREQVASSIVGSDIEIDNVISILNQENGVLHDLRQILCHTLSDDALFAEISWELCSYWFKDKGPRLRTLKCALDLLNKISDIRLRHGVCRLIWDKFLVDSLRLLTEIMEKTGRPPKDRETKQSLQMDERFVLPLLKVIEEHLRILMDASRDASSSTSSLAVDHILNIGLQYSPTSIPHSPHRDSLCESAVKQSCSNYHLVVHHLHLVIVLWLQVSTSLRHRTVELVFCKNGRRAFFQPLDSHPLIPLERVADDILENRDKFLTKIAEIGGDDQRHVARQLAYEWGLNSDAISLMQLISSLRTGNDNKARRQIISISSQHLGARISRILAARLLQLAAEEKTIMKKQHEKYLIDAAGDERERVEWPNSDWREAAISLGKMSSGVKLANESVPILVRIGTIATQYWGIKWD